MVVDGAAIARDIILELKRERQKFKVLSLGILMTKNNPVTKAFIRIKAKVAAELGVDIVYRELAPNATDNQAIVSLGKLTGEVNGIVVQLPLPTSIDVEKVLKKLPSHVDVDGIGKMETSLVQSPIVLAIAEILKRTQVDIRRKQILVVGRGRLVGLPVELWLRQQDVILTVVTDSIGVARVAPYSDVIILGAGMSHTLLPSMIKQGAIVLDAGTSEIGGKIVGDADPSCALKASLFTPVPGGIGPIAVAMLYKNLFTLASMEFKI